MLHRLAKESSRADLADEWKVAVRTLGRGDQRSTSVGMRELKSIPEPVACTEVRWEPAQVRMPAGEGLLERDREMPR